ncbi:MAG: hypothetical protein MHPSP_002670 [Paramarteilia canceri]
MNSKEELRLEQNTTSLWDLTVILNHLEKEHDKQKTFKSITETTRLLNISDNNLTNEQILLITVNNNTFILSQHFQDNFYSGVKMKTVGHEAPFSKKLQYFESQSGTEDDKEAAEKARKKAAFDKRKEMFESK